MQNLQDQEKAIEKPPGGIGPDHLPTLKEGRVQDLEWIDSQASHHKNSTEDHKKGVTETLVLGIIGQLGCLEKER